MLAQAFRTRIFTKQFPGIFTRGQAHLSLKLNSIPKNVSIRWRWYFSRRKKIVVKVRTEILRAKNRSPLAERIASR
jgi:hypothetical protein